MKRRLDDMPPSHFEIAEKYYQSQNYAPADVMRRWAMNNYEMFGRDEFLRPYIRILGERYYYDHWEIEKHDDGMETVRLTLRMEER